ncbi:hypothetical protein [Xanthocytophaga agilis]|uniref:Uncharacterized protein n=1 Tax=Xanthocytophaga agilis TaxID=3048010 RepID=A0AAE3R360_9BACT|nr:hypothetical protein [Xanthocytophaga agilis]MDJ1502806.1 hypothetical protein [Xanthocytophaga agilis]
MEYNLTIFADYFQIEIEDSNSIASHMPKFDKEEMTSLLSVGKGVLNVFTVRNMNVPLKIAVLAIKPDIDIKEYDQVVEASITISSGILSIYNAMEYPDNLLEFRIPAGIYQALIGYQGLDTISEDGLEGNDAYTVFLWQNDTSIEKKIIKEWVNSPY